jgi:aryl-alcohol dehydrogenase-like predicted oxidoreductase
LSWSALQEVLIATKVRQDPLIAHRWPASAEGLSAAAISHGVKGSLTRLGVDRLDLLWAHAEDRSVDLEETVTAFGRLAAEGTVNRLGASNQAIWRVERGRALAQQVGLPGWSAPDPGRADRAGRKDRLLLHGLADSIGG